MRACRTLRKAFLDFQPEIPNQIMQGVWSNIYNSVLSSTVTPTKAALGNFGGLVAKPITTMVGAMARGDYKTIRRASYQYAAMSDTFTKAMKHMGFVFGKASRDPTSVSYIVRDDIVTKNEETMQLLKTSAEAYVKEGEHGPMMLYNIAETLQDLQQQPCPSLWCQRNDCIGWIYQISPWQHRSTRSYMTRCSLKAVLCLQRR